jgi:hypothetical protein
MMTCEWVTAEDGALVMQWTEQKRAEKSVEKRVEMAEAA